MDAQRLNPIRTAAVLAVYWLRDRIIRKTWGGLTTPKDRERWKKAEAQSIAAGENELKTWAEETGFCDDFVAGLFRQCQDQKIVLQKIREVGEFFKHYQLTEKMNQAYEKHRNAKSSDRDADNPA